MKWWRFRIEAELDGNVPPSLLELPKNTYSTVCPLLLAKVADPSLGIRPQQELSKPFLDKVNEVIISKHTVPLINIFLNYSK